MRGFEGNEESEHADFTVTESKRGAMQGKKTPVWLFHMDKRDFEQEEFGMMTKQAELKKQAYASTLKSRALSVLIYLIDRSNKELTCFPAIPTMAEQLHISVSTVKRALHELLDSGYIKKDARFREKNKGQTSNLYTLVLLEGQPTADDGSDSASDKQAESEMPAEASQEKADETETEMCQVEHISFDTLKRQKEEIPETQMEGVQENIEDTVREEECQEIRQESNAHGFCTPGQMVKRFSSNSSGQRKTIRIIFFGGQRIFLLYLWTGEEVSLIPP